MVNNRDRFFYTNLSLVEKLFERYYQLVRGQLIRWIDSYINYVMEVLANVFRDAAPQMLRESPGDVKLAKIWVELLPRLVDIFHIRGLAVGLAFVTLQLMIVIVLGVILYFHIRTMFARAVCGILFSIVPLPFCAIHKNQRLKEICLNQVIVFFLFSMVGILTENRIVCFIIMPLFLSLFPPLFLTEIENHGTTLFEILLFDVIMIFATVLFLQNNYV